MGITIEETNRSHGTSLRSEIDPVERISDIERTNLVVNDFGQRENPILLENPQFPVWENYRREIRHRDHFQWLEPWNICMNPLEIRPDDRQQVAPRVRRWTFYINENLFLRNVGFDKC